MPVRERPAVRRRGVCCALPVIDQAWADQTSALLKALADPTRLTMMAMLSEAGAPVCICDLTAALDLTQPTISHHMAKLREAGLVEARKDGIWTYYSMSPHAPEVAAHVLAHLRQVASVRKDGVTGR